MSETSGVSCLGASNNIGPPPTYCLCTLRIRGARDSPSLCRRLGPRNPIIEKRQGAEKKKKKKKEEEKLKKEEE